MMKNKMYLSALAEKNSPINRLNRTTNTVTKEYRCPKAVCKDCPLRNRCIGEKGADKRIQVNIFEEIVKKMVQKHTPGFCCFGRYGVKVALQRKKQDII